MKNLKYKSKRYKDLIKSHKNETLNAIDAIKLLKKNKTVKFKESIDVHFNLNVEKAKADQTLRTTVDLPNGNGKKNKIAVICSNDKVNDAKKSGADIVGSDYLVEKISGGKIDFDILVCSPDMMSKVGKLGKILGPKGLMPNPKFGTVSPNVGKAVKDLKEGKVEIRCDVDGNLSLSIGRIDFDEKKILENLKTVYEIVDKEKPTGIKGNFINSIYLTSTMGLSNKISIKSL